MTDRCSVAIINDGRAISLSSPDLQCRFHAVWLRDNALDAASRDQRNGQRLVSVLDLADDPRIDKATIDDEKLLLDFSPDRKQLTFPLPWLLQHRYDRANSRLPGWTPDDLELWDRKLQARLPEAGYADVVANSAQLRLWLRDVRRYGFARLLGAPQEDGAVCDVAALFGFVRETNYGRWFDVRTEIDPTNLAYTGLGLLAHTDNPYRDPVPTLQLLACIENSATGGDSVVVDGFAAATILKQEEPRHFSLLTRYCARFEFSGGDGVRLSSRRPMIELAPDGELICVRFNNRSTAPIVDVPYEHLPDYYAAYRHLAEIIERPRMRVTFRLQPGELFIVDNMRVLHARDAYTGEGNRWLQGCYADKDGFLSTLSVLDDRASAGNAAK